MREMKDSGIEWIGEIPKKWELFQARRMFRNVKRIVGNAVDDYDRLALTLNGVIKRSKDDSEGLQPEKFEGYQILKENELVFKMIDLENVNTSRVGLSSYTGLVSPAYIVFTNEGEDNRYAYYWFMFMYYNEVFNHLGGDGVRSALNVKDMLSLPIPNLSMDEQIKISNYLDQKCFKIDSIIEKQKKIIEKLKEYKISIITEAVTKGLNPDVEMKDSGVDWIGKIPSKYSLIKLKNLVSRPITDGTHKTPIYDDEKTGIPFLSSKDVKKGYIDWSEIKYITQDLHRILYKETAVQKNDILLAKNGTTGIAAIVEDDRVFDIYVTLAMIRANNNVILPRYLLYCLNSAISKVQFNQHLVGIGVPNLHLNVINNTIIILCELSEQQKIIEFLDQLCKKIDNIILKLENSIKKYIEYRKSLIYEVVTGKKEV